MQSLELVSDKTDQQENLTTYGQSFCVNQNMTRMNISLGGLSRREARYVRIRFLYTERNDFSVPQNES